LSGIWVWIRLGASEERCVKSVFVWQGCQGGWCGGKRALACMKSSSAVHDVPGKNVERGRIAAVGKWQGAYC
jgi:hypothetical protein